jgi:hypothetical protein
MTAHNVSMSTTAYAPAAFGRELQPAVLVPAEYRKMYHGMVIRRAVERASTEVEPASEEVINLLRECWRRMGLMKLSFEHAELSDGTRSRERSAERRREEDDWSRLND